jgi:hypothetical protein
MICVIFLQIIIRYENLKAEIIKLRVTAPLSLFCLDCSQLNEELASRAQHLRDHVVQFVADRHRDSTKEYELYVMLQKCILSVLKIEK